MSDPSLEAKSVQIKSLPMIDIAGLLSPKTGDRQVIGNALHDACLDTGFFYITGHGVSSNLQNSLINLQNIYSLRYIGSLVADFHRNLLEGGVFLYPKDTKNPNGKLRLMYEANPLSFIIEKAGGIGTTGTKNILHINPTTLHERVPLIIGNSDVIENILV